MAGGVYKYIDVVGTSGKSIEDAIATAVTQASKSVRNIYWFEVAETRGKIEDGKVVEYQVRLRLGFKLD
jgi:flavin-binding protein dodecin